ncbi:MAG: hypothetical protein GX417_10615 [Clostridiales bacterium]|nr:hypothetical protein [Clostridiales bacterium]
MYVQKKGNRTVDFSIVKEGLSRYQYGLMGILLILSLIVTVFTLYQIALLVLLQIDLMQDLPVNQTAGPISFLNPALPGRILRLNQSIYFDPERLFSASNSETIEYKFVYLRNSHIIVQLLELPRTTCTEFYVATTKATTWHQWHMNDRNSGFV